MNTNLVPHFSSLRRLPHPLLLVLLLAVVFPIATVSLHAAKEVFIRSKPHVNVGTIGPIELRDPLISFEFLSDIEFGPQPAASGTIQFVFVDGSVRWYEPVAGALLEGKECLVFSLGGRPSGELDPTDAAVAVYREDPARPGVVFVKLQLPKVFPQILAFEVPGEIQITPRDDAPPPPDDQPAFRLRYPPQEVRGDFDGDGDVDGRDFIAWGRVGADTSARGFVAIEPLDGEPPMDFEPLFGTFVPGTETGPGYIVLLLALGDVPIRFENLAVAMIHPHAHVPGCDIWDFSSNGIKRGGAPLRLTFDAERKGEFGPRLVPVATRLSTPD
jgi:hypothetical protein